MKYAIVFPGQGSQSIGMLADLTDNAVVQNTFEEASDVLGYDLWQLTQKDPDAKLNQTEFTQPALLAADVALWRCLFSEIELMPRFLAGHSLGEYAALVCANSLALTDAIRLVANRGKYMQEAVAQGEGAMAAIIGLDDEVVADICLDVAKGEIVAPANFNSKGQVVVAGQTTAVNRVILKAKEKGAKIAKLIPVSVPSHCALMQSAAERLAQDLAGINIQRAKISVVQNVDVAVHTTPENIRNALITQLISPVRWVETIEYLAAEGVDFIIECGPGKVLSGLNKRIIQDITNYNVNDAESLAAIKALIEEKTACH